MQQQAQAEQHMADHKQEQSCWQPSPARAALSMLVLALCTGSTRGATSLGHIRLASLLQVILHGDVTEVANIDDDLSRELAFYTQVSNLLPDTPLATESRYVQNLDNARLDPCPRCLNLCLGDLDEASVQVAEGLGATH